MYPSAILFGSVGAITETTELQRQAFNAAFAEAGLDWIWGRTAYLQLLRNPGGMDRIASYAAAKGVTVDAHALHESKIRHFEAMALQLGLMARPGVVDLIDQARALGVKIGFVTTTGPRTVGLVLGGLASEIHPGDFDVIIDRSMVEHDKPNKEAYETALRYLDIRPEQALAIEDTPESARSAIGAGVPTLAFPGHAAQGRVFPDVVMQMDTLTPDLLHMDLTQRAAAYSAARSTSEFVSA